MSTVPRPAAIPTFRLLIPAYPQAGPCGLVRRAGSNLAGVKLLGRKNDDDDADRDETHVEPEIDSATSDGAPATTAPKGKPTPRRNEANRRRGPVAPAPQTSAEARKRRKELKGPKLTKEERKVERLTRRADMADRRERMMSGDESFLLPRDKGPVRRYVRDIVDARRNVLGLFMPAALALIVVMLALPAVQVQQIISLAMLVLVALMIVDALILARKVNRMVDEKFRGNTESRLKLGFYASSRASQLRRMRTPRPMVNRGDDVS